MPRIKLKEKAAYTFSTDIRVRVTDCNYGGHLGNHRLLALLQEARVDFLARFGYSEFDCGGVSLILGDAVINYKNEAFPGDVLRFEVAAGEFGRKGFRLFYRVSRPSDGKLIALAETGMVCYDYTERAIRALPEAVRRALSAGDFSQNLEETQ